MSESGEQNTESISNAIVYAEWCSGGALLRLVPIDLQIDAICWQGARNSIGSSGFPTESD